MLQFHEIGYSIINNTDVNKCKQRYANVNKSKKALHSFHHNYPKFLVIGFQQQDCLGWHKLNFFVKLHSMKFREIFGVDQCKIREEEEEKRERDLWFVWILILIWSMPLIWTSSLLDNAHVTHGLDAIESITKWSRQTLTTQGKVADE